MFDIPSLSFSSSTLRKLDLKVQTFGDCLYLLDGRFNQLHTFYIELVNIHPPDEEIQNNVCSPIFKPPFFTQIAKKNNFFSSREICQISSVSLCLVLRVYVIIIKQSYRFFIE